MGILIESVVQVRITCDECGKESRYPLEDIKKNDLETRIKEIKKTGDWVEFRVTGNIQCGKCYVAGGGSLSDPTT